MICKICNKEIESPECYWEGYDCCSACVRKVAQGMSFEEFKNSLINPSVD